MSILPSLHLEFSRTGFFRHSNKELWWIGSENAAGLQHIEKLRQRLACGLKAAGVSFDKRPFRPHITLGREIKRRQSIELPEEKIIVPVSRISLIRSEHVNRLLVYTEIGHSFCGGEGPEKLSKREKRDIIQV